MPNASRLIGDEPGSPATVDQPVLPLGGPPAGTAPLSAVEHRVVTELRARKQPLYAILDAARDPLVLARLLHCEDEHQSLYEGPRADRLVDVAPHLVALPAGTAFLETLVRDGWGKSWGVYLTCDRPFQEVRKHLRRFLTVEIEGGKKLLFRFYDPRVLRVFLPTCTPAEAREFFGSIQEFLFEEGRPKGFLIFSRDRPASPAEVPLPTAPEVAS